MFNDAYAVNSDSMGDPTRFRELEGLVRALEAMAPAPRDKGRIELIVVRGHEGLRSTPGLIRASAGAGMTGDAWSRKRGKADTQITVMEANVASLIANGQPFTLFGDNLFVDLDLSVGNLPPGSRVRAGEAVLEVTSMPHNGCKKFQARFGTEALRFVSFQETRHRNLRGIHMRVVEAGDLRPGDSIDVLTRGSVEL